VLGAQDVEHRGRLRERARGILSTGAAGKYPHDWWPEGGIDGMLEHGG
jgi:hypothetical protein